MRSWAPGLPQPLSWLGIASLLVGAGACAQRVADPPASGGVSRPAETFRVYRDPNTGQFREPPAGVAPTPMPAAAPSALTEESAPGGGRMIRLRGAFHSHFVAAGANGANGASGLTASCASGTVGSPQPAPPSP